MLRSRSCEGGGPGQGEDQPRQVAGHIEPMFPDSRRESNEGLGPFLGDLPGGSLDRGQ